MKDQAEISLTSTVAFRLGVLGAVATERFAAKIEAFDVKPKHVGLLSILAGDTATSQLDVARAMNIAPSLVVALADHLQELGAVSRARDPQDRRRQILTLTLPGSALLADCARAAQAVDRELTAELSQRDRTALDKGLDALVRGRLHH